MAQASPGLIFGEMTALALRHTVSRWICVPRFTRHTGGSNGAGGGGGGLALLRHMGGGGYYAGEGGLLHRHCGL